jgi:hypothetical protein
MNEKTNSVLALGFLPLPGAAQAKPAVIDSMKNMVANA